MGLFRDNDPIIQMKHNNGLECQLVGGEPVGYLKHGRGFELGTTETKSSWRSGRDLNAGPPDYKSGALTAQPRCLYRITDFSVGYTVFKN